VSARLYPFGRNGGQRVDTARTFQPTTTSEQLDIPPPLVHAPRIPSTHRPIEQRPVPGSPWGGLVVAVITTLAVLAAYELSR
jgi:hypothetical protein